MVIGLYFHIPFCTKKCPYCHFYVVPDQERYHTLLLEGLELEWQSYQSILQSHQIRTLYFGGGTPSLLKIDELERILQMIRKTHSLEGIEITLEANPELMNEAKLKALLRLGINRLSFGVQSFDEDQLHVLGRTHSGGQAKEIILLAHQVGFKNISLDLMYDLPRQTYGSYENSLRQAVQLPITHLSLYNLTIEPHTSFFKQKEKLIPQLPDPEMSLRLYELSQEYTKAAGFQQYEISAFAKPGFESKHNSGYWAGTPFIGFGPSAFSYLEGKRFSNTANLHHYADALKNNLSPVDFEEELSQDEKQKELLAIRLRMLRGVNLEEFPNLSQESNMTIKNLIDINLLQLENNRLSLTPKGILLYDSVAIELI